MKKSLLLFAGAAALSLASCSQEKTTDTTTTTTPSATATTDTAAYRTRSNRVSQKFISDMKITDPAMQSKVRTAYYNRSKRYGDIKSKYASDTTGMAAAMRQYNTDTDTEFQGVLTDPSQYQSYQSSRSTYDESNYMDDASSATTMPADNSSTDNSTTGNSTTDNSTTTTTSTDATSGAGVKTSKTKLDDGSKIKVKGDGTVKVKDSDGSKSKM